MRINSEWYVGRYWLITALVVIVGLAIPMVPVGWLIGMSAPTPRLVVGDPPGVYRIGQRVKSSRGWKEFPKGTTGTVIATPLSHDPCDQSRYRVAFDHFGKWCEYYGDIEPE